MPEFTGDHEIVNALGLHARAASKLVALANKFSSDVFVGKDGQEVNGKSILGVLIWRAPRVRWCTCVWSGAMPRLLTTQLVASGFGEI